MNKILIVENDLVLATFYQDLLSALGQIKLCHSGNLAKAILAEEEFDLILSDYQMENGNGIELAQYINSSSISTPLILLTGFATKEIAIEAVKYGLYAFLEKRCHPSEIYKAVELGIEFGKNKKRHLNFSSMGEISSILMHEIVDPLNRSLSRVELIEKYISKGQNCLESLHDLRDDLEYISRIITNVRVQLRGTKDVYLKKFQLTQFVDVLESLQPDLLINYVPENLSEVFIKSDVVLFNQVLDNLIKNSKEAMQAGQNPSMKMTIFCQDTDVYFEFENNTPVIPEKLREQIFEAFVSTKKDSQSNLGIGLYFCRKVLKSHGGRIYVKNTAPTTFVILLPKV